MKRPSKLLSVLTSIALALFLLTGAIAVPILCRPFYYSQIEALALPARTGWSPEIIRGAFDEVMDYLLKGAPFGTGQLKWSESGMSHFADCKGLFWADFILCAVAAVFLLVVFLLARRKVVRLHRLGNKGPCFWAFILLAVFFLIFGIWALADFDSLFTAFHSLLFPGKTNWIFDWRTDEIILVLPEEFWVRAAGLIALLALGVSAILATLESMVKRERQPTNVYEELKSWGK